MSLRNFEAAEEGLKIFWARFGSFFGSFFHFFQTIFVSIYHSPRNFYKLIPLPFFYFFFVIFMGIRCSTDFVFVTSMRSSGSRVDIAQKPNKNGQILDQRWKIFFYEINSSQDVCLYCKNFGVDGTLILQGQFRSADVPP